MPIEAKDFLDTACKLLQEGNEPAWRSAASRSYYAAYHGALKFADNAGFAPSNIKTGMHEQLSLRYQDSGRKSEAIMLKTMHATRVTADYQLDKTLDKMQAEVQYQTAARLLERLSPKQD
jgi:uncharacterized protein (UPF0332 family)